MIARTGWFVLLGVFAVATTARSEDAPFQHPGILTSQAELEAIQKHVATQDPGDVNFAGYVSAMKTRYADVGFVTQPEARVRRMGNEGDENRFLDSSWIVTVWCAAGELIRYGSYHGEKANWPAADVARFCEMIRRLEVVSSQIVVRPFNPGSNWGTSSMLGEMAAGVFWTITSCTRGAATRCSNTCRTSSRRSAIARKCSAIRGTGSSR